LNKFYLYSSLSKHAENSNGKMKEIFMKALDQYENEVMKIFNCDTQWPVCLYDFTYKNKIPQYLCFRTSYDPPFIIEEYFYPEGIPVTDHNH
jgi:hypothetical protein